MAGVDAAGGPAVRAARRALVAVCLAYVMVILDTTVVNVALPATCTPT